MKNNAKDRATWTNVTEFLLVNQNSNVQAVGGTAARNIAAYPMRKLGFNLLTGLYLPFRLRRQDAQ